MTVPMEDRRKRIVQIIDTEVIASLEELMTRLSSEGIEVQKSALNRDIRALGLIKVPLGMQRFRYIVPRFDISGTDRATELKQAFQRFVRSVQLNGVYVLLYTREHYGVAIKSLLASLNKGEIQAMIADSDTVLILAVSLDAAHDLKDEMEDWLL